MNQLTLPNGENLFYLDKITALDIYREIYEENEYFQFGLDLKDGDCIIDAGANIGLFTRYITSKAKNLKIYCFEPLPPIIDVLEKNLELIDEKSQTIEIIEEGLSNIQETVQMFYYPKVCADSTVVPFDINRKSQQYTDNWNTYVTNKITIAKIVPKFLRPWIVKRFIKHLYKPVKIFCKFRPLSEFIAQYDINAINFLKIDAENYEWPVINGIKDSDWKKIQQIAMEVHTHIPEGENLLEECITFLEERNFQVFSNKNGDNRFEGLGVYMVYGKKK